MSRHLFWKSGHRKTFLPITEEREFEKNLKKLETLEENSRKLLKDVKLYIETNAAVGRAGKKVSQEFLASALCQQHEELKTDVEKWDQANNHIEQTLTELNNSCQKVMVEPLKKLNGVFPCAQAVIKKREQSLQDYAKCQQKVEKYQDRERTGPNIVKIETSKKALNAAREEFNSQNFLIAEEIPMLYINRISYLEPCVQALIRTQVTQATESFKVLSELSTLTENKSDYAESIQWKVAQIKALSITIDD